MTISGEFTRTHGIDLAPRGAAKRIRHAGLRIASGVRQIVLEIARLSVSTHTTALKKSR